MKIPGKLIAFVLGPLVFVVLQIAIPDTFISPTAHRVFAVAGWTVTWWVAEAVPLAVTSLLPLVLFPFLGVMNVTQAASSYASPIIFLFMGGFMIALALEKHRLHERIALNLVRITGTSGNGIIAGFMIATGFLSMWISNTATAMMMLPIASSVVGLMRTGNEGAIHEMPKAQRNFALGLMLMVGYASSIGGLATIIGTPPNVVFKGLLEKFYGTTVSFSDWLAFGIPATILMLISTYLLITRVLFPNRIREIQGSAELIRVKLQEMGSLGREEKLVLVIFSLTSFFWIFQQPLNAWIGSEVFSDTNIGMTGGVLMFIVPVSFREMNFLLTWADSRNLAWGILLLFGGGLCLADGLNSSGIIQAFGGWIAARSEFNSELILILIIITIALTELMSNVALVNIFIPVVFGIANGLHVNPVYMAIPVTLSASLAFMFPISTPPNAIVFSSGYIRMKDMVRAGLLLNVASVIIIWLLSVFLIPAVLK